MQSILALIREAARDTDISVRSYSGRGMYGKVCTGVTGDMGQLQVLIACVLKEATQALYSAAIDAESEEDMQTAQKTSDSVHDLIDKIMDYSTDSMGLSTVLYWPDIEWVEEELTFAEWKLCICEIMGCSLAWLERTTAHNLQDAFDAGDEAEDVASELSE